MVKLGGLGIEFDRGQSGVYLGGAVREVECRPKDVESRTPKVFRSCVVGWCRKDKASLLTIMQMGKAVSIHA